MDIKKIFIKKNIINKKICVKGWIKNIRNNKFIILNDGTYYKGIQIIINKNNYNKLIFKYLTIASSIKVKGIVKLQKNKIDLEIKLIYIYIYYNNKKKYIQNSLLQKKNHSFKYIRKQNYLRFQTNLFSNILRIKNFLFNKINNFLYKNNFMYIHTPIITNFNTENILNIFSLKNNFFNEKVYLTVSGQLENEIAINGFKKVYSFGPVFRAEKSNTNKHLAEFWMLEIEIAFCNFKKIIFFIKKFIKYILKNVIYFCKYELSIIDKFNNKKKNYSIIKLSKLKNNIKIITYNNIIKILKKKYKNIKYGVDINSNFEKYLFNYFNNIILIIINHPIKSKVFYMKKNKDNKTVKSVDVLFPKIGEIIGGSQREENLLFLKKNLKFFNIKKNKIDFYLKTRLLGNTIHSGFGLGFDRLIQFITNVNNIKDIVEFPRYYKKLI